MKKEDLIIKNFKVILIHLCPNREDYRTLVFSNDLPLNSKQFIADSV